MGVLLVLTALLFSVPEANSSETNLRETPLVLAVKKARASVVNIHSEKTNYDSDSIFASGKGRKVNGMGTGIIVDSRGYIVTNHHVVNGVDLLRVTLDDGSIYTANVVSFDRKHDLAIIKIKASQKLQVMPLGTSSDIMLAETVFAVGNAFGYEHTVTAGIVSSLSRDVDVNEKQSYNNLIQTDASINPGNSGGPLLNLNGDVVGINVAIRAGAQRIGFAIPIDDARKVIAKLLSIQQLDQHWHGIVSEDHKQGKIRELIVQSSLPSSPAYKAGLQKGDIILQADNMKIADSADLERAFLGHASGDKIKLVVRRNHKTEKMALTIAELNRQSAPVASTAVVVRANSPETTSETAWRVLGIRLQVLSKKSTEFTDTQYRGGMRILNVRSDSPAAESGIRPGDVLVGMNVWETVSEENVSYVLEHPKLKTMLPLKFYVLRRHETLFGNLKLK